ncbi:MAG TPA: type 1 glutamine amidotransferase [Actinophytocola sp.]|uniref:type 1 glutamine amidotransferase n=1 Tax=Actinophytocola sp. TaxID=1872138 RepID=UPI002DBAF799|nr:type 1 glutamine amidotransferase [Actinophytocola sp.]HEU5469058.1 type 1 glutamine amidotransferase [Actinophytocola sp.]
MVATRLLLIQPDELDPPGPLAGWLLETGAELEVVRPAETPMPDGTAGYQGIVCLGGAMGAGDDLDHPWLADVRRLLARAVTARLPVLAICLGAQLLAAAVGGRVAIGEAGPEVGPGLVAKRDAAWRDPLFADLPFMPDVLQFHADAVVTLPPGTELLAAGTRYPNQAFRVGPSAYGIQFHIETTPELVLEWARTNPDAAATARDGDLTRERLTALHRDLEETWRPFVTRFVQLAAGKLEPATPARPGLPLA